MTEDDPYIRMTARYGNGTTVYTNAFARYSEGDSPYREFAHPVRWGMTVIWNLLLLSAASACIWCCVLMFRKRRH